MKWINFGAARNKQYADEKEMLSESQAHAHPGLSNYQRGLRRVSGLSNKSTMGTRRKKSNGSRWWRGWEDSEQEMCGVDEVGRKRHGGGNEETKMDERV